MNTPLKTLVATLALLALASCGAGPAGEYTLDTQAFQDNAMKAAGASAAGMSDEQKDAMKKMFADVSGTLNMKADNTWSMSMKMPNPFGGDPKTIQDNGTWAMDGESIKLTKKEGDKDETVTATLEGGVLKIEVDEDGQKMEVTFNKK